MFGLAFPAFFKQYTTRLFSHLSIDNDNGTDNSPGFRTTNVDMAIHSSMSANLPARYHQPCPGLWSDSDEHWHYFSRCIVGLRHLVWLHNYLPRNTRTRRPPHRSILYPTETRDKKTKQNKVKHTYQYARNIASDRFRVPLRDDMGLRKKNSIMLSTTSSKTMIHFKSET